MVILGQPKGIFDLTNSDNCVGSYLSKSDVKEILEVTDNDLSEIPFEIINDIEVIDERELQKLWYGEKIPNATPVGHPKSSLDELLLIPIIKRTYPNIQIERQIKIGRFSMDLKLTLDGRKPIFIEFDGPYHFATSARYGIPKHEPFRKKKMIEDTTGFEVINWAYWIQRCSNNVKAIFEKGIKGFGALWSTNVHFGDFYFPDSADIIEKITQRFNAVNENGYGYFYEGRAGKRNKPQHAIIEQIKKGKKDIRLLLPKGYQNKNYWLPDELKQF
jgi:very-short-patch-repair endonuclease